MGFAQFSPDIDVYDNYSVGEPLDTQGIGSNMTALIYRLGVGSPQCGVTQKIQQADSPSGTWTDHPAAITFNGYSAVVPLPWGSTKRYLRLYEEVTAPTDDPRFVAGGVLFW